MARAFTARQAMAELNISRTKFYQMAKNGEIKTVKVGKKILVPAWVISQFLGEGEQSHA